MTANINISMLDTLHRIALMAGDAIMEIYATDFDVDAKGDSSPVTIADKKAEQIITAEIKNQLGDTFPLVGEEAFSDGLAPTELGETFWLVDPLDGTREFISRNGEFTVNIALIDCTRPVLGVVYAPAKGLLYMGSPHGASLSRDGNAPEPISCRQPPAGGLTALVSRSHNSPEVENYLADKNVTNEISAGSSLKLCLVAEGKADIYPRLGRTMEWDIAAGHAVLNAAGGSVRDLSGRDLSYGKPGFENPHFVALGSGL